MPMISHPFDILPHRFIFRGDQILLQDDALPDEETVRRCADEQTATDWFSEPEYGFSAVELKADAGDPARCGGIPLREFFWRTRGERQCALSARAKGLLNFRKLKRFCSVCGGTLRDDPALTARTCTVCAHQFFPQIEPAVIVLVSKGDQILLARHLHRAFDVYTCIAGFVETGETIEAAVVREVKEETGIDVKDVRYVASQSWPFPDQLMLAFRAEYAGGTITPQSDELRDARFFPRDCLPATPPPGSVAWKLIHGCFE